MIKHLIAAAGFALLSTGANAQGTTAQLDLTCSSNDYQRQECPVQGDIISVQLTRVLGEQPCFLGYTWGLEDNKVWTANGCRATFLVTLDPPEAPTETVETMRERVKRMRNALRTTRQELEAEREAKRGLETQLADANNLIEQLQAGNGRPNRGNNEAFRASMNAAIGACRRHSVTEARKAGAVSPEVVELMTVRPLGKSWVVIGRIRRDVEKGERVPPFFRCTSADGAVVNFENTL